MEVYRKWFQHNVDRECKQASRSLHHQAALILGSQRWWTESCEPRDHCGHDNGPAYFGVQAHCPQASRVYMDIPYHDCSLL